MEIFPLKMCGYLVKGIELGSSKGICRNWSIEPSGYVIENSPVKILPSGNARVP